MAIGLKMIREARGLRSFDVLFKAAAEINARDEVSSALARGLGRTFVALGRDGDSLPLWQALREMEPKDAEARFNIARIAVSRGADPGSTARSAAEGGDPSLFGSLQEALRRDGENGRAKRPFRHIAICGVSFCGSTLFDRVLGGLPGVKSIGESHWLTKEHDGAKYVAIDIANRRVPRGPHCTVCGPKCLTLTRDFRVHLAIDPNDWYGKIARRLETDILVSADKNIAKLVDNDPLLKFHALVLFKSPEQAWVSQRSKLPTGKDAEYYYAELVKYSDVWNSAYRALLDTFSPEHGKTFLCFDEFASNPRVHFERLCQSTRLPTDLSVLTETRPGHAIGGNSGAMRLLRDDDYRVNIRPLLKVDFPGPERDFLAGRKAVQETFDDLMSLRLTGTDRDGATRLRATSYQKVNS